MRAVVKDRAATADCRPREPELVFRLVEVLEAEGEFVAIAVDLRGLGCVIAQAIGWKVGGCNVLGCADGVVDLGAVDLKKL